MEVLKVENLKKSFGKKEVLKGVSLKIEKGEIVAILGPNASGKTTFIKCILGLVIPDEGTIKIKGKELKSPYYKKLLGYMPQEPHFPENLTPLELIELVSYVREEKPNYENLVKIFKLEEFMNRKIRHLSGGTKQKVNALIAFSFNPELLILDEPTVGLDPISSAKLKEEILRRKEMGVSVLLTSHIVSEVEQLADRIEFIVEGRVRLRGSVKEIKDRAKERTLERAIIKLLEEEID